MALNATTLAALIKANLAADPATGFDPESPAADPYCNAIAAAVVQHIISSAVVTIPPGVAVATAGTAAAQVGATTAPGIGAIT